MLAEQAIVEQNSTHLPKSQFIRNGNARIEASLGAPVPIARIVQITFKTMHKRVEPIGEGVFQVLDDLMGGLPFAAVQVIDRRLVLGHVSIGAAE